MKAPDNSPFAWRSRTPFQNPLKLARRWRGAVRDAHHELDGKPRETHRCVKHESLRLQDIRHSSDELQTLGVACWFTRRRRDRCVGFGLGVWARHTVLIRRASLMSRPA